MLSLVAVAQQYVWGRNGGDECTVAEMHALNADAQIDQAKPYAELWVGTHPSGPTKVCMYTDIVRKKAAWRSFG